MSRLADYFMVVGYDSHGERNCKILQRFPEKDWPDVKLNEGIELFCQPQGWALSTERQEPKFFVSVLTDVDANRHYCACLSFNETVSITPSKPVDEEEDIIDSEAPLVRPVIPSISHSSIMYAPKCLVLVSRLDYIETFRNCLGIIYCVYIENMPVPLETLVGNILGCVQVPPPGGPQVRFSIGAGDRQALQPPLSPSLPVTHTSVNLLFHQLGIRNVLVLFCAIMTEQKILFHSKSYNRLTEACRALTALMYPFRYTHVYIPLLPSFLVEVLSTPTPFIMGVHSSLKTEVAELMDVIVADLDGGALTIPDGIQLPLISEPLLNSIQDNLSLILQPELSCADNAFPPLAVRAPQPVMLDKEIRAVFMRMFAQLLQGYRSCLTLIRIHPKPVITFHKAAFLGERNLKDCDFTRRVLECMFFTAFVSERGPPWRPCDVWDELYTNLNDMSKREMQDPRFILEHIQELATQLYRNECPNPQSYPQKILSPTEGAFARIHQPTLPLIDGKLVQEIINHGMSKNDLTSRLSSLRPIQPRIVPIGPHISNVRDNKNIVSNSARRLEVLRNCVNCIFENKISDARKTFPAVMRALQSKQARLALCNELSQHISGTKAMLEDQQFDLVVRLMNCALQSDSDMDEYGIAYALLPLATNFCRKLCTGVIQFAYTCIQEHAVWLNQQFWEAAFYLDVQKELKALYTTRENMTTNLANELVAMDRQTDTWHRRRVWERIQETSALEIAAEQMRLWHTIDPEKQKELMTCEENTMYSQAIHYANRMVYLLIPLDIGNKSSRHEYFDDEGASNSIANSVVESDSADAESGFEDQDPTEKGSNVIRQVSRFIDKVCNEGGVTSDHIRNLHAMIPGVVHMHIETLEAVYRESRRRPTIHKPKILTPSLLNGEELILDGLRVYLLSDGREESIPGLLGGPPLLPAEGAIFLTNYRIIFKGTPCDSFACEQVILRAFPVSSLTKEKKVSVTFVTHLDLQEGMQLRSCTFQLMKLAFDNEVPADSIENLRKMVHKIRHPPSFWHFFAFAGQVLVTETPSHKSKEKNATLRGFGKKTLLKAARKVGVKQKPSSKRNKYVLPNMTVNSNKYMTSPGRMALPINDDFNDDGDSIDDFPTDAMPISPTPTTDVKTLERMTERSYIKDWQRLGICNTASPLNTKGTGDQFRLTSINSIYTMCRSYPALLVIPASVPDESIRRFCRHYRQSRIPSITWRHPRTKALLLRGAGHHGKSMMGMLKSHQNPSSTSMEMTSSSEQHEKYLSALVAATPAQIHRWGMSDSSLSIDSLLLAAGEESLNFGTLTPEVARRSNAFNKAIGTLGVTLRNSGGKGPKNFGRWGSLKDKRQTSQASLSMQSNRATMRLSSDMEGAIDGVYPLHKASLYILGEKAHMKSIKIESSPKVDFISVDYYDVRHTKTAFKKLMRACLPNTQNIEPDHTFYKLIENSEWLHQIQNIMKLSGTVVDLMDLKGASVAICLEDGWDITAQVSSIAQLCLDPHYRTIEGFRVLVEKEWIGFGHRFSHRSNLSANSQASGFAPTFLQFLDVVHQIQQQYPMAFEFNDYYLRFLAYHSVSCRFRTFLFDCEVERVESGVMAVEDKRGSLTSHHKSVDTTSDDENIYPGGRICGTMSGTNLGQSVFDYIEKQHARNPIFFNFMYTPDFEHPVLRPQSHLQCLDIWNYYIEEDLHHGPGYDLEIIQLDTQQEEEAEAADGINKSARKIVLTGYENLNKSVPDAFSHLLEEIHKLETELGHLPQKWKIVWDNLEYPLTDSLTRHSSFTTALVRSHGRLIHKRSTLEILMRGKIVGAAETSLVYCHPHRFERYNFTTPTQCDHCQSLLWGPVKTGMRCIDCGYSSHEKCTESVPNNCTKYKNMADTNATQTMQVSTADNGSVSSGSNRQTSNQQYYEQFSSNVAENRTHEGYLYKRGALLKGWKQRWFVLDSIKHQLRYYDAMEDSHCKGFIDLGEVISVIPASPAPVPPKKTDDRSFFDLRTSRRTYNFCAADAGSAQEWIEKLQACLQ